MRARRVRAGAGGAGAGADRKWRNMNTLGAGLTRLLAVNPGARPSLLTCGSQTNSQSVRQYVTASLANIHSTRVQMLGSSQTLPFQMFRIKREARQSARRAITLISVRNGDRIDIIPTTNRRDFRRDDIEPPSLRPKQLLTGRAFEGKVSSLPALFPN